MTFSKEKKKPTRRDLLLVLGKLQTLSGRAIAMNNNDRNPNQHELLMSILERMFDMCIEALSFDKPIEPNKKDVWGEE